MSLAQNTAIIQTIPPEAVCRQLSSFRWTEAKSFKNSSNSYTDLKSKLAISRLLRSIRSLSGCELTTVRRIQLLDQVVA